MKSSSSSLETETTRVNIPDEVKTTEVKESYKDKITINKIDDVVKLESGAEQKDNGKYIQSVNNTNIQIGKEVPCGYFGRERRGPTDFWVQFNFGEGARIPDGSSPMYYDPDRNLFVRIVFAIVLFMLILTAGFVTFVYMTDMRQIFLRFGFIVLAVGICGMLCLNYAMMCSACTRVPPCNFIVLFLAVCFMSLITAYITARYRTQIIMLALMATTVTVLVCLCLACTRFDFTQFMLYAIVIGTAFSALALIIWITMIVTNTRYKPVTLIILIIGTLINVIFLTMELQMILGGKTIELSEDDYALGAFMLYTSIIDVFIKCIQILGIFDSG